MADLSFNINNQIIRDVYDTPQEALAASSRLGCDGYRTYLINGQTKYVPCSSFIEYERALRYYVSQGIIGAFGSDTFGDKLIGLQFANSKTEIQGDPFFTLGNFSINKSTIRGRSVGGVNKKLGIDEIKSYTLSTISEKNPSFFDGKDITSTLNTRLNELSKVEILFDKTKLDSFVLFSSLKEKFKNALIEINKTFPAALNVRYISTYTPTILQYNEYSDWNQSKIKVNLENISNPFNIEFTELGNTLNIDQTYEQYRNFSKTYSNYVLLYDNKEYEILSVTLPRSLNDFSNGLTLVVNGQPFHNNISSNNTVNVPFFIKLKKALVDAYPKTLSDLSAFLLNKNIDGNYYSEITLPIISDGGTLVNTKKTLSFPIFDELNINMFNDDFDIFVDQLNELSEIYDEEKTNILLRFLTTDSLKEFDTDEQKFKFILSMYANMFDSIKKYIDGIQYMRNISYDKIENIPDLLIKNFATMLGFKTQEIQDEETLFNSLFNYEGLEIEKGLTPQELDIELWRRILINSFYLYKSKGTRKSIDFILKLVGMPESVFDINEYIYVADNKLDTLRTLNAIYRQLPNVDPLTLVENVPFDLDGYPTKPLNSKYQERGGYIYENKEHIGPYDFGAQYINEFKKFNNVYLFDLQRTIDNHKSWVFSDANTTHIKDFTSSYTNYAIKHGDLSINSKEVEVYLSLNKVFDITIYRQYYRNTVKLNSDLHLPHLDTSNLSFNQFLRETIINYINPKNRKVINTYPTLSKIYFDYIKLFGNPVNMKMSLDFLDKFDTSWVKLIEQFVPATTILNAGKKIQNSQFLDNKFTYRHGQNNAVDWLGTDGSEFQTQALRPVYQGSTNITTNKGSFKRPIVGDTLTYLIRGNIGDKIVGVDPTVNQYYGKYYSLFEYCDNTDGVFYIFSKNVNYSDSEFNGDILVTGDTRRGVFAVYNDNLYRLNTKDMFPNPSLIDISDYQTASATLSPDIATINGLKIWEKISHDVDSRTVVFKDTPLSGVTNDERVFYMTSIGKALAYIDIKINFTCPPPKPHVCYYNISGDTLNLTGLTGNTTLTYVDNTGVELKIQQPKFYGYSLNKDFLKPDGVLFGKKNKWAIPFNRRFEWVDGMVYYKDEIIADIKTSNKSELNDNPIYIVTGDTFTASGTTYPSTELTGLSKISDVISGIPTNTSGTTGGMYGLLSDRAEADPLMHVTPVYINKFMLNPNADRYTINLTKILDIEHVFSKWLGGTIPQDVIRVNDNTIENELYISNTLNLSFDGFYPVSETNVGPFYENNNDEIFIHTLADEVLLAPNVQTNISIESLNETFEVISASLSLNPNTGFYIIQKNASYTFDVKLYFESTLGSDQTVIIRLVNSFGKIYDTKHFEFNGLDSATNRVFNFVHKDIFLTGEQVYITIEAIDYPCTLSRYEKIEYEHSDPDYTDYNPLNDPRFRLFFNDGNQFNNYVGEGYSISPIYNENDIEVNSLFLAKNNIENDDYFLTTTFDNLSTIKFNTNTNDEYLFNKLYYDYYNKYDSTDLNLKYLVFDKQLNYDKIDIGFKVRSKQLLINTPFTQNQFGVSYYSTNGSDFEQTVSFDNYFLGGTAVFSGYSDAYFGISIGKNINKRISNFQKNYEYVPNNSLFNNEIIGTGDTKIQLNIDGIQTKVSEYQLLNYSNNILNEITSTRRYVDLTSGNEFYYTKDNVIYNSEIYQKLLEIVPEYNKYINNYELNDIVKYKINSYKTVVTTETGSTIEERDVYRLFVCINDIDIILHTRTTEFTNPETPGAIIDVYAPFGSRSCFIEIEKYNTANFSPWGYDELRDYNFAKRNVKNYTGKVFKQYDESAEIDYQFGDIVIGESPFEAGTNDLFRVVYPKNLKYISGKTYQKGEHVYHENGGNYRFYTAKEMTTQEPTGTNSYWFEHKINKRSINDLNTNTGKTFNIFTHQSIDDQLVDGGIPYDNNYYYSSTVCRLPKSYPLFINLSYDIEYDYNGIQFVNGSISTTDANFNSNNPYKSDWFYYDVDFDNLDGNETSNRLSTYIFKGIQYQSDVYLMHLFTQKSLTDKYTNTFNREGVTNIYLKPDANSVSEIYSTTPFENVSQYVVRYGTYPIFERLCNEDEQNNPKEFTKLIDLDLGTFDYESPYLGKKYVVNRGVLYKVKDNIEIDSTTGATEPVFDTTNWVEKDFCLINNFVFYKDRVSVKVYENDVYSLSEDAKNKLYFYNNALQLKSDFKQKSFSGSTINERLINCVNFYSEVTDINRRSLKKYGTTNFRLSGKSIFLDYYFDRDELNIPLTGEFVAKLTAWNPCGQMATTFIALLFDTNINQIDFTNTLYSKAQIAPNIVNKLPYLINVVVNQTANSNAELVTTNSAPNSDIISQKFVINSNSQFQNVFNVAPNNNFEIKLSYNTQNKQTTLNTAYVDDLQVFIDPNYETSTIKTQTTLDNYIETRTLLLKNIARNQTVIINLKGIEQSLPTNTPSFVSSVQNTNIKNINL